MEDRPKRRMLIRLVQGYGLGDVAQFTCVLKHLRKYRPHWIIDFQAARGRETCAKSLCRQVFHDDDPPHPTNYQCVIDVPLHDCYNNWADRPNTKVTACLHETFGIDYDPSLGRYECVVNEQAMVTADKYLRDIAQTQVGQRKIVIVHYMGNSNANKKNLQHWQAKDLCRAIIEMGRVPLIFDWRDDSPLPDQKTIFCAGVHHPLWGGIGGGDAEMIAAVISQVEAYIGVDSGPGHIASATDTPALICWTHHHPIQFHDPAPNTVHLVPENHRTMSPAHIPGIANYFTQHYRHLTYRGEYGLVGQACQWLADTLGAEWSDPGITIVVPPGERTAAWVLAKARSLIAGRGLDVVISGPKGSEQEGTELYRRFPWVRSVQSLPVPVYAGPEQPANTRGHTLYVAQGRIDDYHFLIPNVAWQEGRDFSGWLSEVPVDVETVRELPEHLKRELQWTSSES